MKANEKINIKNLRGFDSKDILKEGFKSYFPILPGEDLDEVMKANGLTEQEIGNVKVRIMRGNPHWVSLETKEEVKEKKKITEDYSKEKKRKEELFILTRKEQFELLEKLGIEKKNVPGMEPDRVNLIYELENREN